MIDKIIGFGLGKFLLYLVPLVLIFGFYSGYSLKGKLVKADIADQVIARIKEQNQDLVEREKRLTEATLQLAEEQNMTGQNIGTIEKEVIKYVRSPAVERTACTDKTVPVVASSQAPGQDKFVCDVSRLSVGAACLLDAARGGLPASVCDAAIKEHGEGQAASEVTQDGFILNDIQVVRMYLELGNNHDALVEAVEAHNEKEMKRK